MEYSSNEMILSILAGLALLVFGLLYAYHIAMREEKPARTWVDVVIGDGATDIGSFIILYAWSECIWLALVPVLAHLLTGGPMILGQLLKHRFLDREAEGIDKIINGNGGDYD